jgi:hypothetical protein
MNNDVHKEAISIAVLHSSGRLLMESIIETKASNILHFIQGLSGNRHVTFEEGTWAAWFYDLPKPHVTWMPGRPAPARHFQQIFERVFPAVPDPGGNPKYY